MKLPVINLNKTEIGKKELPIQFSESIRTDLIKRAVVTIEANKRQPYGADPMAGKRASAELSRRRRKYRGSYGIGISRVPRKILSRRGTRMNWVGAFAPGTVKGRRAHPPKSEKIWSLKLNIKERRKAIRSALSATVIKELVIKRGHDIPDNYPFILDTKIESIEKTKDVKNALEKIGLTKELARVSEKKVRAGRGTMRGRKYKRTNGPLLVVSDKCKLIGAGANIPGLDIVKVNKLNALTLAPGTNMGRLTIFTEAALNKLGTDKLFLDKLRIKKEKSVKTVKPKKAKPKKVAKPVEKKPIVKKPVAEPVKKAEPKTKAEKIVKKAMNEAKK